MRKTYLTLGLASLCWGAMAQTSFMTDQNVAVFYPANYQSEAHSPSPIFLHDLAPVGTVPADWRLRPVYTEVDGKSVATIKIAADDDLYGTGEVVGPLRRNGRETVFWNRDNYGYFANEGKNLYQSHPWVLGLRKDGTAYGVIADNTWKSRVTLDGEIRFESEGPAFRVIIIERNSTSEVLAELAKFSGPMELPPLWAIGYQQCRYSYFPDTRVKEIADTYRQKQIPCDVVWMDIDYMDGFRVFTFSPEYFPNPEGLADYLHQRNMKAVYMIDPGVKLEPGYFLYDQGKEYDFFIKDAEGKDYQGRVWPGQCVFPDYTRTEVRSWWSGLTRDFMRRGVDGLWNDMNEPAIFEGVDGSMDPSAVHMPGEGHYEFGPHLRYHNIYGMNMVRASRDGSLLAHPDKRPFVLSRDNFLGGQRYGATWNGDNMSSWEHLMQSIPMTINLGLSGQPFNGPDMGGFGADCDAELLAHWVATGIYFPFARNHNAKGCIDQEPWVFGQKVEDVYRTAVNRRYFLMPYFYTLFHEAATVGTPVMRPLFMADEKDPALREEQRVYMLGNDLMIIPRWANQTLNGMASANTPNSSLLIPHLPKGDWDIIKFEETEDNYQAFVAQRPGSIVPMANLVQSTDFYSVDSLTVLVNPAADGTATGKLYEDAGEGFAYRTGDYAISTISATSDAKTITVSISQIEGKRQSAVKYLRVGIVTDGKVTYSPWTAGTSVTMKQVKDKLTSIDPAKLKWSDIDIASQPTTQQKLDIQTERAKKTGQAFEW